ncbi:LacI family DNA-binding transcriptional regulator [Aquabacterium humicola]|uniref:LacI family DNA-binding transcriptional regulator n=1 Tax=Aquabacterium humicola TaxID=3237377 RepID=UPI002543B2EC|nr:LacI family DNA-binding transcriptional regulator [Rubrivivax pictus]
MRKPESTTRPPTIIDVAQAAGVSKSTVSLVLQGSPLIREETADRVRAEAQRIGYVYNRRAAELRSKSTNVIGVVINDLMNPFFAEVLVGIERRLVDAGYIVFMAHTHDQVDRQRRVLLSMREQNVAGIALCPALGTPKSLPKEIQQWGLPLVIMVRSLGPGAYDFVGPQNEAGMAAATRHLIAAGHRRIAFLGGQSGIVYEQRLAGYRSALSAAGLEHDDALLAPAPATRAGGHEAMMALLDRSPRSTAAVCYNDITAFGAMAALGERGLRAGTDFALIGFDNVLDAAHSNPPLSTMDIRPGELGEQAATLLMARIGDPATKRQTYLAEPRLQLRQSA